MTGTSLFHYEAALHDDNSSLKYASQSRPLSGFICVAILSSFKVLFSFFTRRSKTLPGDLLSYVLPFAWKMLFQVAKGGRGGGELNRILKKLNPLKYFSNQSSEDIMIMLLI